MATISNMVFDSYSTVGRRIYPKYCSLKIILFELYFTVSIPNWMIVKGDGDKLRIYSNQFSCCYGSFKR